jgi:hypothetical protein
MGPVWHLSYRSVQLILEQVLSRKVEDPRSRKAKEFRSMEHCTLISRATSSATLFFFDVTSSATLVLAATSFECSVYCFSYVSSA